MGNGTIIKPWTFDEAMATGEIEPGDTAYLRGGIYSGGPWTQWQNGAEAARITFRAYPGERPVIDGNLIIDGKYVDWIGIEHTNLSFTDRSASNGGTGINVVGDSVRVINCFIHNFSQGIQSGGSVGKSLMVYGCLIYHNGWSSDKGHGLYPQNVGPDPKTFKDNVVFDNFGYGFHLYGSSGHVDYFTLIGNTIFNDGSPIDAALPNILYDESETIESPILIDNVSYHGVAASNNYVGDPDNWTANIDIHGNYMSAPLGGTALTIRGSNIIIDRLDGNTFIGNTVGFDTATYSNNTYLANEPTSGQNTFLRANNFDGDRANLTIFNYDDEDSVQVDVSSVFNAGDSITARNVQDYWIDTQSLTVAGDGTIAVDTQVVNRSVERPVGTEDYTPPTTFPRFGAFVLERV